MADFVSIIASLTAARTAAKGLLEIKSIADSAEAKMAIAEMQNTLADTKGEIADLKLELQSKDECIRGLEAKLSEKEKLVRHNEMYFEVDEDGKPAGDPFCPRCHEVDGKSIHLVHRNEQYVACPSCEKKYPRVPGQKVSLPTRVITSRTRGY